MKQNLRGRLYASIGLFACVALAVPSQAFDKKTNTSQTATTSASSSTSTATAKKADKQHCMKTEASTGSRVQQRKCMTIAEWEALGYEFDMAR